MSSPLVEQEPSAKTNYAQWTTELEHEETWIIYPHVTELAISSANRVCGEANYVQHGDCTVFGESFAIIREEITLGYLESTHEPDGNYAQRIRRREGEAFQAGMRAGSLILGPRGVSQAAACDGVFFQTPARNIAPNPPPGVLPIWTIIDLENSRLQKV